jgi:hypothetical protein
LLDSINRRVMAKKKDFNEVTFDDLYVSAPSTVVKKQEEPVEEKAPEVVPLAAVVTPPREKQAKRGGVKKTDEDPYKMLTTKVRISIDDLLNQHSFFQKKEKKDIIEEALQDYFKKHKGKIPNY